MKKLSKKRKKGIDKPPGMWYYNTRRNKKGNNKMKYSNMSCNELRRRMNQIDNDFRNFPHMNNAEKSRLTYERSQMEYVLIRKLKEIVNERE